MTKVIVEQPCLHRVKDNKGAEKVNQTNALADRPDNTSTKKNLAALTQGSKNVSTIDFFEKMLEMWNKGDNIESPQCLKCGELFQEQKSFFNHVINEHSANALVMRKYKIKPSTSTNKHPDLQEGEGSGQVLIKGTGLPGQP